MFLLLLFLRFSIVCVFSGSLSFRCKFFVFLLFGVLCFCGAVTLYVRKFTFYYAQLASLLLYNIKFVIIIMAAAIHTHTHSHSLVLVLITHAYALPNKCMYVHLYVCVYICVCMCAYYCEYEWFICDRHENLMRCQLLSTDRQTFCLCVEFFSPTKTNNNKFRVPKQCESGNVCKNTLH